MVNTEKLDTKSKDHRVKHGVKQKTITHKERKTNGSDINTVECRSKNEIRAK